MFRPPPVTTKTHVLLISAQHPVVTQRLTYSRCSITICDMLLLDRAPEISTSLQSKVLKLCIQQRWMCFCKPKPVLRGNHFVQMWWNKEIQGLFWPIWDILNATEFLKLLEQCVQNSFVSERGQASPNKPLRVKNGIKEAPVSKCSKCPMSQAKEERACSPLGEMNEEWESQRSHRGRGGWRRNGHCQKVQSKTVYA